MVEAATSEPEPDVEMSPEDAHDAEKEAEPLDEAEGIDQEEEEEVDVLDMAGVDTSEVDEMDEVDEVDEAEAEEAEKAEEAEVEEAEADGTGALDGQGEADAQPTVDREDAPLKPRRALTAWALYIAERHGNKPSKEAGEGWKVLTDEEKVPFQKRAAEDKERFLQEQAMYSEWLAANPEFAETIADADKDLADNIAYLPQARVRKMIQMHEDSRKISKEGLFLVCKSVEQLLGLLTKHSAVAARRSKRKNIQVQDFGSVIYGPRYADLFQFAHDDFPQAEVMKASKIAKPSKPRAARPKGTPVTDAAGRGAGEGAKKVGRPAKAGVVKEAPEVPVQTTTMKHFFSRRTDAQMQEDQEKAGREVEEARAAKAVRLSQLDAEEQVADGAGAAGPSSKRGKASKKDDQAKTRPGTNILDMFAFASAPAAARDSGDGIGDAIAEEMDSEDEDRAGSAARAAAAAIASENEEEEEEAAVAGGAGSQPAAARRRRTIVHDSDEEDE